MLITELPEAPLPGKRHLFLMHFQTCYLPSIKAAFFELFISSSSLSSLIYAGFVSHKLISGFAVRRGSSSQINSNRTKTKEPYGECMSRWPLIPQEWWRRAPQSRVSEEEHEAPGWEADQRDAAGLDN